MCHEKTIQPGAADHSHIAQTFNVKPGLAKVLVDILYTFGKSSVIGCCIVIFTYLFKNIVDGGFGVVYRMSLLPILKHEGEKNGDS